VQRVGNARGDEVALEITCAVERNSGTGSSRASRRFSGLPGAARPTAFGRLGHARPTQARRRRVRDAVASICPRPRAARPKSPSDARRCAAVWQRLSLDASHTIATLIQRRRDAVSHVSRARRRRDDAGVSETKRCSGWRVRRSGVSAALVDARKRVNAGR